MKIFALDTSSKVASIAILEDQKVLLENTLNDKKTHSENLMPMIEGAFQSLSLRPADMDVFGVTIGPGAFTGIRIGISTIKGIAEAVGKPVVGLSALEVLAAGIAPTDRIICPILDAQRNQVYAGLFQYSSGEDRIKSEDSHQGPEKGIKDNSEPADKNRNNSTAPSLTVIRDTEVLKIEDLVKEVKTLDGQILFVGDGLNLHGDILAEKLKDAFEMPFYGHRIPRASILGELTRRIHLQGRSYSGEQLKPIYLRKSQAEVQFDEREKALGKGASE